MKKLVKWTVITYSALFIGSLALGVLSMAFPAVQSLQNRISPPVVGYVFFDSPDIVTQDLAIGGQDVPRDKRVSKTTAQALGDFDRVVFVLNSFEEADQRAILTNYGLDPVSLTELTDAIQTESASVSLGLRLHPLPLYVRRFAFAAVNAQVLEETYRSDCILRIIQNLGAGERDQALQNDCKINQTSDIG